MNGSVLGWGLDNNSGGTVQGVTAGQGLSGGTISTSGTISIDTTVVPQLSSPNIFTAGPQSIRVPSGANRGLVIRGGAGQTANLQEWENNGATTLAAISANGAFVGNGAGLTNLNPATLAAGTAVNYVVRQTPWTLDAAQWVAWRPALTCLLVLALAMWGFANVLGRQSAFAKINLDA